MRRFSRKTTAIAAGAALVLATSVLAYAFWTGLGSGSGQAQAGTNAQALVVKQTVNPTGLVPGGPPANLQGNFDNPNPGAVFVNQVTGVVAPFVIQPDGTKPPCTETDFAIGGAANVNAAIPPGVSQGNWSGLTLQLINKPTNQDNCKNVTVTINYTAQ